MPNAHCLCYRACLAKQFRLDRSIVELMWWRQAKGKEKTPVWPGDGLLERMACLREETGVV